MIIIDNILQGSDEWYALKMGIPSASNASRIICNNGKPSKQRESYLYELVGERLTGQRADTYKNGIMEAGQERETQARSMFELLYDVEIEKIGVIYKDIAKKFLCSPDGICKNKFGLELKNPLAKTQVKYFLDGGLPDEYFGQVQFSLYVTGFKLWYFMSYVPAMKPIILEIEPDEKYQKALAVELELFCNELDEITEKIRR